MTKMKIVIDIETEEDMTASQQREIDEIVNGAIHNRLFGAGFLPDYVSVASWRSGLDFMGSECVPYVQAAQEKGRDGEVEIDDNAMASLSDEGGAYVSCWLWVSDCEASGERLGN